MKDFVLPNPMCIRHSEQNEPSAPTPQYRYSQSRIHKWGLIVTEKDGEEKVFNSVIEAADYYDTSAASILRAISRNMPLRGNSFKWDSSGKEETDVEANGGNSEEE